MHSPRHETKVGSQSFGIVTQNRVITKAKLEAKKQKMKYDIPFANERFPPLFEHPSFYVVHEDTPIVPRCTSWSYYRCNLKAYFVTKSCIVFITTSNIISKDGIHWPHDDKCCLWWIHPTYTWTYLYVLNFFFPFQTRQRMSY